MFRAKGQSGCLLSLALLVSCSALFAGEKLTISEIEYDRLIANYSVLRISIA